MEHLDLTFNEYTVVFFIGVISSFMNTIAGGGSLLTLPLLILYGLDANMANATNRVAIVIQSMTGSIAFHRKKVLDVRNGLLYSLPALLGAIIGALVAVDIDDELMKKVIAFILIGVLFAMLFKPKEPREQNNFVIRKLKFLEIVAFFFVGLYVGFIQAGVGYLMVFVLVIVSRYNLLTANALKIFLTLTLNIIALIIFIYYDLILWRIGIVLSLGAVVGSLLGAKITITGGERFIRYAFFSLMIFFILNLLGVIDVNTWFVK